MDDVVVSLSLGSHDAADVKTCIMIQEGQYCDACQGDDQLIFNVYVHRMDRQPCLASRAAAGAGGCDLSTTMVRCGQHVGGASAITCGLGSVGYGG